MDKFPFAPGTIDPEPVPRSMLSRWGFWISAIACAVLWALLALVP